MLELSLHVLDVVQNSIAAGASLVKITIREYLSRDELIITVEDNGHGLEPEQLSQVTNPFFTSKAQRKVGLGLALFKDAAQQSNGWLKVESSAGQGTTVTAQFQYSHIDRVPLGAMEETITVLIACNPNTDFIYHHLTEQGQFIMNTCEIRDKLQGMPINTPAVLTWITDSIRDDLDSLH